MEAEYGSAEDILLNNRHQQNASSGNHPGFEDGKTLVKALGNVHNQEKMVAECFAKPDNTVSSSCCLQVDTKANESGLLAETGKEESNLIPDLKNEGTCCPGTKKPSPQSLSPDKGHGSNSFDVSFGQLPSPRFARPSLNRCSLKLGMNRRKSLPPLHLDISELSKAISLDMPETERMAVLLLSSFQYSAQKLECSLRQTEGFNTKTFEQNVNMLSEELRLHTKKLILDGTLQKCFEDPRGGLSDPALNASISALKENIVRFSEEGQAWDKLLQTYQKNAEEITRQLQQSELKQGPEEPCCYLGASQAQVLQAKPDYQKILDHQGEVFYDLERMLDEIHQMVKVCQVYMEEVTQYLHQLSAQLASRTFNRLEKSPARKLLRLLQTKPAAFPPPDG
ncbi:kinetochore-associated protein DSN1 homolog isoform X2 [Sceloporus undulatus]|uniref:kinetochore-associated protein DSN1 homolog isoform X2 n=1 Tax=Sceloporus undulatus TaxID=8520 RepID=UPI001C4D1CDB|nr:kinetochore-associated protein DSN1 homolog isoform X2 [Sceloporus undulatus]